MEDHTADCSRFYLALTELTMFNEVYIYHLYLQQKFFNNGINCREMKTIFLAISNYVFFFDWLVLALGFPYFVAIARLYLTIQIFHYHSTVDILYNQGYSNSWTYVIFYSKVTIGQAVIEGLEKGLTKQ